MRQSEENPDRSSRNQEILPRDRFLSAVERSPVDGVSLDLGYGITSYTVDAHNALCNYLGISDPCPEVSARMLNIVYPVDGLQDYCGDLQFVAPGAPPPNSADVELDERTYRDEWDLTRRLTSSGLYYDFINPPLEDCRTLEDCLRTLKVPESPASRFKGLREQARAIRETGHAVGAWCFAGIFEMVFWLRGYRKGYLDFGGNTRLAEGLMDALLEIQIEFWSAILNETEGLIDVALLTEDLGTQTSLMISPKQFRTSVKPRISELIGIIKEKSPSTKILLHSDGAVFPIISDFINMGVDILNPIQPGARDMDPARIKAEFGQDLSFHGAIDIQELLRQGTPESITASIHKMVELLGGGGGYVVAPAHCIQPDVPPENVLAMVQAVRQFERYP